MIWKTSDESVRTVFSPCGRVLYEDAARERVAEDVDELHAADVAVVGLAPRLEGEDDEVLLAGGPFS